MLTREWFSAQELADMTLPGMPTHKSNILEMAKRHNWLRPDREGKAWRKRSGRGGGVELHYSLLPMEAQAKLTLELVRVPEPDAQARAKDDLVRAEMWAWFDRQPQKKKDAAKRKAAALHAWREMQRGGMAKVTAATMLAADMGITVTSLYNWERLIHGQARADWMPFLTPRHIGRTAMAECSPEAWEYLKAIYLRLEKPTFQACWRLLTTAAEAHGWVLPSGSVLERRLKQLPPELVVNMREGPEAFKRSLPAQQRDHRVFHALEAVNADFHKWDVFVQWPDGRVGRPQMVAIQDIYSGKILAWRVDENPNKEALRLAIGDLVEQFGIPDHCWFDNGRTEASKWISGGARTRYRFKLKDDEPLGVLPQLGTEVHFTTPYHGQSKPIERAFRDFAGDLAKHPEFAGAYTGNTVVAKPENYGSKAVPLETFLRVVGYGIQEHNARIGRRSPVAKGRSFDETFAESYARAPIRKATQEQRRVWLMAAEQIGVRKQDATIHLEGNRFYSAFLQAFRGQKVTVRFDPQVLQDPLHVYRADGAYLGAAECIEAVGFADMDAAKAQARTLKAAYRAVRELEAAEMKMTLQQAVELTPTPVDPPEAPEAKVVRAVWGNTARQVAVQPENEEEESTDQRQLLAALARDAALRGGALRLVPDED